MPFDVKKFCFKVSDKRFGNTTHVHLSIKKFRLLKQDLRYVLNGNLGPSHALKRLACQAAKLRGVNHDAHFLEFGYLLYPPSLT